MTRVRSGSLDASRWSCALAALLLIAASWPTAARSESGAYLLRTLEVERERSGLLWARFDADVRQDMLVADDTMLRLRLQQPDGTYGDPIELELGAALGGALFDLIDLDRDGISEIAVLHATGVDVYAYDAKQRALVLRKKLIEKQRGIRFLHLARQDFVYDLDGDGDDDLVYPVDGSLYIFDNANGVFTRRGEVDTARTLVQVAVDDPALDGFAETRIRVPRLSVERKATDSSRVEIRLADGRTVRSLDGAAALSGEYVVEKAADDPLARFKRRHGIVLKENETFQAVLRDLDADGIDDYTIVYKNRIWVYRGKSSGFDFDATPDQLVKVSAEDRISALLLPLNDDARPDLVLFKYRIPSVGRLVAALAIGLRAEIEVLGYVSDGKPVFSRSPSQRSTLVLRVPPLLQLIGELEEVVQGFRDIMRPMQGVTSGDFDGDGRPDVLRISGQQMEIYRTREGEPTPIDLAAARGQEFLERYDGHRLIQRLLFGQKRREVTIEAAMALAGDAVAALQTSIVGEREPEARIPVEAEAARRVDQILAQDLDGDGRDDILLFVEPDREQERKRGAPAEKQTIHVWLSSGTTSAKTSAAPESGATASVP